MFKNGLKRSYSHDDSSSYEEEEDLQFDNSKHTHLWMNCEMLMPKYIYDILNIVDNEKEFSYIIFNNYSVIRALSSEISNTNKFGPLKSYGTTEAEYLKDIVTTLYNFIAIHPKVLIIIIADALSDIYVRAYNQKRTQYFIMDSKTIRQHCKEANKVYLYNTFKLNDENDPPNQPDLVKCFNVLDNGNIKLNATTKASEFLDYEW